MINHNPYNLPERPPLKQTRILAEASSPQYHKNQSLEHPPSYTNYPPRPHPIQMNPSNHSIKKATLQVDTMPIPYYPAQYQNIDGDINRFLQSGKSPHTSSASNLANVLMNNSPRASFGSSHQHSRKQKVSLGGELMHQNFGVSFLEFKQLSDKVESLNSSILKNQQRVEELQRTSGVMQSNFLPNHSGLSKQSDEDKLHWSTESQSVFQKFQKQLKEQMRVLKHEIQCIKEDIITFRITPSEVDQIVGNKIKPHLSIAIDQKIEIYANKVQHREEEQNRRLQNEIKFLKNELEESIHRNHEFLTSVIARLEREIGNRMHFSSNAQNNFKSSALKCSGSAILLRFVESFRVRKNNNAKNGEAKIYLTDNTYYIDQDGYLLDKDQFYLVDDYGYQVKLQQQHIALLKQQNVLQ